MNDCVETPWEFVAVNVSGNTAGATDVVPDRVAVPLAPAVNVIPAGSAPVRATVATGEPLLVTANENGTPATAVAEAALVICGIFDTVKVNDCVDTP